MSELLKEISPALIDLAGALLTALIAFLGNEARKWIAAKTSSEVTKGALNAAVNVASMVVNSIEKTTVAGAKAALSDGKITKEEYSQLLANAKDSAVSVVKETISAQFPKVAANVVNVVAEHAVEAAVLQRSDLQNALKGATSKVDPTK
jgi:hypothetical protein